MRNILLKENNRDGNIDTIEKDFTVLFYYSYILICIEDDIHTRVSRKFEKIIVVVTPMSRKGVGIEL